jgi:Uma2 family endonuclease
LGYHASEEGDDMSATTHEKTLLTAEDFWEIPDVAGKRFELVEGELIEMPAAGGTHGYIVKVLLRLLDPFVVANDLGEVFGDGLGYIISRDPDVVRVPDVSFVARERIPAGGIPEGFIPFAPDLAVEVVSPNDRADDVHDKVREYLGAGTRMVLVLWPKHRSVSVHEPGLVARELGPEDELDGGDVLPGFRVRVGELFAVEG